MSSGGRIIRMYLYLLNNKKAREYSGPYVIHNELFFLGQIFHSITYC